MVLLGEKAIGDIVKIKENGVYVNYIVVNQGLPESKYDTSCDGVWLLREKAHSQMMWDDSVDMNYDYPHSDIHEWLNTEFLNSIDEQIREQIKTVKIPYQKTTSETQWRGNGVECKAFLLSGYEVGYIYNADGNKTPLSHWEIAQDGVRLAYFTDNNSTRVAKNDSEEAVCWWTRSPRQTISSTKYVLHVPEAGHLDLTYRFCANRATTYVRPAFILPSNLQVTASGYLNDIPVVTGNKASGSDLGELSEPFEFTHSVADENNDSITINEYIDDVLTNSYPTEVGTSHSFKALNDPKEFQKILNGKHTATVIANDGMEDGEPYFISFNKQVRTAVVTLETPLQADDVISAAVISVAGVIPRDAELQVLVTNNALDSEPIWENMTQDYEKRINHVFSNRTAQNGFAFNFKVTVKRGASEEEGFIEKIGGAFE